MGDIAFIHELSATLVNTYNADRDRRKAAEESLENYWSLPNAFTGFLQLAAQADGNPDVRMASALALKNKVRRFWGPPKDTGEATSKYPPMTIEEKEHVKVMIIDVLLIETNNTLRVMFAEITRALCEYEFPDKWPALLPTLVSTIGSSDRLRVYNSLIALRKIVKRFEYKVDTARLPLFHIMENALPAMQTLLTNVKELNIIEAGMVMHVSLKILWSCTMYKLPPKEVKMDWDFWFPFLAFTLEKPLPEASEGLEPAGQPTNEEARERWPWWKMKKWSSRCIKWIMQRYGNPKHVIAENKEFAKVFRSETSISLLGPVMNVCASKASGGFVTSTVQQYCLAYLQNAVEMAPTWKLMKPHLDFIVTKVCFPALFVSAADQQLFESDPVEYVRKIHSSSMESIDHKHAASGLLEHMARLRENDVLPLVLDFVQGKLNDYQGATGEKKTTMHVEKDACLQIVGHISNSLIKSPEHSVGMEPFILNHIIPDFQSTSSLVRSRCCWVLEWFTMMDWSRLNASTLNMILEGLMSRLRDPSLAVQNSSACSLRTIIGCEPLRPHVRPIITHIVTEYFRIMAEVESESVLGALGTIVDIYSNEIVPIAPTMVAQLAQQFQSYADVDDDDEAVFAATNCIEALGQIVEKLDKVAHRSSLVEVEQAVLPLLMSLLSEEKYHEYLDNVTSLMAMFTFMMDSVSEGMWRCCGLLLVALDTWAADYLLESIIPLQNLMIRDISSFYVPNPTTGTTTLATTLFTVITSSINTDCSENEAEARAAADVLTTFLACTHDMPADVCIPIIAPTWQLLFQKLSTPPLTDAQRSHLYSQGEWDSDKYGPTWGPHTKGLRVKLMEAFMALIYMDTHGLMDVLNLDGGSRQMAEHMFTSLFESFPDIQGYVGTRLVALTMPLLLLIPVDRLPPYLQQQRVPILVQAVTESDMLHGTGDDYYDVGVHGDAHPRKKYQNMSDIGLEAGLYDDDDDGDDDDDSYVEIDGDEDDEVEGGGGGGGGDGGGQEQGGRGGEREGEAVPQVPDGGYEEEEDCLVTEDNAYYAYLEQGRADREDLNDFGLFMSDEALMEANLQGLADYQLTTHMDSVDVVRNLLAVVQEPGTQAHFAELRAQIPPDRAVTFDKLLGVAQQRVAACKKADPGDRAAALKATEKKKETVIAAEMNRDGA